MQKIVKYISWNKLIKILRSHGGYFVTTFIHASLPLLFLPILTRYLAPAEYANISLFRFIMAISNSLIGVSIPIVVSKNFFDKSKDFIAKIIGNAIILSFLFSLLLIGLVLIFSGFITKYIDLPIFWIILIPLVSFFFIIYNIGLTVMRNRKKIITFSKFKISNIFINILLSVLFVVNLLWGWEGRVWGIVISFFISSIFVLIYLNKKGYLLFELSKNKIRHLLVLIIPLLPNSLQAVIISQVGVFFMQLYFTKELLGVYSVGFQISFFIKLLYTTISFSWAPYLYEQLSNPDTMNKAKLTKLYYLLFGILFLGYIFLYFSSGFILKLITTKGYFGAKEFIPWFALGFLFQGMGVFLTPILIKGERQKYISLISIICMILLILQNIILTKFIGYIGIAVSFFTTSFLLFIGYLWMAQIEQKLPWIKVFYKGKSI